MLRLTEAHWEELYRLAEAGYPREVCGFLLGSWDGADRVAAALRPVRNAWSDPHAGGTREALLREKQPYGTATPSRTEWEAYGEERRFLIAPADFAAADREARVAGLAIVGIYHSHPDHPAAPSAFDGEMAMPEQSYVIISVRGGRATELRSWCVEDSDRPFQEEPVVIL
ncbi:MAG: M67 family metallopeptidase [Armatimonadetes bacterium]|nr:M67 family metallopeptidase [Armatimonadota bacterium]